MDDANEEDTLDSLEAALMDDEEFLDTYNEFTIHCSDQDDEHNRQFCPGCQFEEALEVIVDMHDGFEHISRCKDLETCSANNSLEFIKHSDPDDLNDLLLLANRCQRAILALSEISRDITFLAHQMDEGESNA